MKSKISPVTASQSLIDLVKYPVLNEKSNLLFYKKKQYMFDVDLRLTKPQIKKLFENLFNVNVISLNTHIPPRKRIRRGLSSGSRPQYKRVILTLKENQFINYLRD
uniref:ribosomal protein L23 n=1 Tax=Parallela transversalis TaxID=163324 RepID=UPI0010C32F5A|nr:ribosomal protein L23 [Parallela transversalis]AYQ22882.1 ribosomal protein L23 [Parallela transversalis]